MSGTVWYIVMIPCCMLLSGIGVFSWRRKKPMWFWTEPRVSEAEISDVVKYNRENAVMWWVYSLVYWAAFFAGLLSSAAALALIGVGCIIGLPLLAAVYKRIYEKYRLR